MTRIFSWKDRATWPTKCNYVDAPMEDSIWEERGAEFKSWYSVILSYHACRPVSVDSYLSEGIRIVSDAEIIQRAKDLFCDGTFPEISEHDVEIAAQEHSTGEAPGFYAVLDDEGLIKRAGHYLVYGSENLMNIAGSLSHGGGAFSKYAQYLKTIGKPTMFEIELPTEIIGQNDLLSLVREINNCLDCAESPSIDFTFLITQSLPAENIKGYSHPRKIYDQFGNDPDKIYYWETESSIVPERRNDG
jgi:hypothetical protein